LTKPSRKSPVRKSRTTGRKPSCTDPDSHVNSPISIGARKAVALPVSAKRPKASAGRSGWLWRTIIVRLAA
jgi:hypothetical protein